MEVGYESSARPIRAALYAYQVLDFLASNGAMFEKDGDTSRRTALHFASELPLPVFSFNISGRNTPATAMQDLCTLCRHRICIRREPRVIIPTCYPANALRKLTGICGGDDDLCISSMSQGENIRDVAFLVPPLFVPCCANQCLIMLLLPPCMMYITFDFSVCHN